MSAWRPLLSAAAEAYRDLTAAGRQPREQQTRWLRAWLAANQHSSFGHEHRLGGVSGISDYQQAVPIRCYDDLRPWIDRCAEGETGVLTSEAVVAFEETGGSASGRKLIPYTYSSLRAFRGAVLPWLLQLVARRPRIADGKAYIAASPPPFARRQLRCGIPVGVAETDYLGADLSGCLSAIAVQIDGRQADVATWRTATLQSLVSCEELSLISIWSPTFLLELLDGLVNDAEKLMRSLSVSGAHDAARRLSMALRSSRPDFRVLWPALDTISMWTDGASAGYARALGEKFPGIFIDPKSLLATESPMTVRVSGEAGCAPALTSAFIEFVDDAKRSVMADELVEGNCYRLVLTTPGGLWRYDIGDEVLCRCLSGNGPLLEFQGRTGVVSDLVGEKLTESFVAQALSGIGVPALLVPHVDPPRRYEIWVDGADDGSGSDLAARVDRALSINPQYAYARSLGQLSMPQVVFWPRIAQYRRAVMHARGSRWGDVKPTALVLDRSTLPAIKGTR